MLEQRGCHLLHRLDLRLVCSDDRFVQDPKESLQARFDSAKVTMNDPVANHLKHCTVNTIPTGAKDCRDIPATDTFGPSRQEDPLRRGLRVLDASPRHSLHDNSTGRLVFRAMRKIQHADAELYQAFFTHRFCG